MRRLLPLLLCLSIFGARAEAVELHLLETSDRHGHIENAPLLAAELERERAEHPGRTLLLDGGDLFTGTLESDLGEGAAVIRAMNALGYDAAAVGNHDFDFGPVGPQAVPRAPGDDPRGALEARIHEAKFPLLTSNILEKDGKPLRGTRPFVIKTVGGVKVGIVGGTTEDLPRTTMGPNLVGLKLEPLAKSVEHGIVEARAAGAKVVIVVVHAGAECPVPHAPLTPSQPGTLDGCKPGELVELAHALAKAPARPDAIFGGHTHRPNELVVDGIPVAQGGASGELYATIDLDVDDKTGKVRSFTVPPPTLLKNVKLAPDEKVAQLIAPDLERAAAERARPLGATAEGKMWRAFRTESPFGNLVADELREAAHTDVALMNGGGLRADLPAGTLTYGSLFEALPFANRMATMKMSGAALKSLFAANAQHDRGVLSVSGATVDVRCKDGKAVASITLASGKPVGDGDEVTVAASDFLALGGDDLHGGGPHDVHIDLEGPTLRDVVADGLKRRRVVRADDHALYDPQHPRLLLPAARPLRCEASPGTR